jgi:hypothetical protein
MNQYWPYVCLIRITCHRTQGEITLGHKSKNKRAWRSMLFWLNAKPWAKNLMLKENMFWLFCRRLNSFLTSWPRVGYFALVLESFSSWLFCLTPRVIFCFAIPYTRYHETWNTPNELYPTCFWACLFVPCMVSNYATNFTCFAKSFLFCMFCYLALILNP